MNEDAIALPEQVSSLYRQLVTSAAGLNVATDEYSQAVAPLDSAIRGLKVGIECWVPVRNYSDDNGEETTHELGFAKIGGDWGIALRIVTVNERHDFYNEDRWAFNDAPRMHRIEAIDKLPALLERLIKKAESATKKFKETTVRAREVAAALERVRAEIDPPKTSLKKLIASAKRAEPR